VARGVSVLEYYLFLGTIRRDTASERRREPDNAYESASHSL
jgi:hypothetical protein